MNPADWTIVTVEGHQTCPHCRALVRSTICTICGKTSYEEVATPAEPIADKWWTKFENDEPKKLGITLAVLAIIGGVAIFVLTRPDAVPTPNALPPPASTTTLQVIKATGDASSVTNGSRPDPLVIPGAEREVGDGPSPWETVPPVDFISGLPLDMGIDYKDDIARVAELISAIPDEWRLDGLRSPELLTFGGRLDAGMIESTQPFAARIIRRGSDGLNLGEIWVVASAGSEAGDDYLSAARERWDFDASTDQFSTEVGVRLWRLGGNDERTVWGSDLEDRSMVIIQAAVAVDPFVITVALQAWRTAIAAG